MFPHTLLVTIEHPLVGSVVGIVLLIFHFWLVQWWDLFCLYFTSGWFSGEICSAYILHRVGSVVGFVLHPKPV
jgi:hypothetical protein